MAISTEPITVKPTDPPTWDPHCPACLSGIGPDPTNCPACLSGFGPTDPTDPIKVISEPARSE